MMHFFTLVFYIKRNVNGSEFILNCVVLDIWCPIINPLPDWVSLPRVLSQVKDEWLHGVFLLRVCCNTGNLLTRTEVYALFGKQGENIDLPP